MGSRRDLKDAGVTGVPFRAILILSEPDDLHGLFDRAGSFAGIDLGVMVRDRRHRPEEVARLAANISRSDIRPNVTPIINAPAPDLELPSGWWIHLPASRISAWTTDGRPFGASVHSMEECTTAVESGAGYVVAGPIWPTGSKPGHPGIGISAFAGICRATDIPVFGLGGIDRVERVREVLEAGAYGIACRSCGTEGNSERLNEMLAPLAGSAAQQEGIPR